MVYVFWICFAVFVVILWSLFLDWYDWEVGGGTVWTGIWTCYVALLVASLFFRGVFYLSEIYHGEGWDVVAYDYVRHGLTCTSAVGTMLVVGVLMIWGFNVLYKGTLHSIILTWGLDEAYRTATGKNSDSDAYKRALKILGGGAALVAIYWSRLPGIDALITRMAAGMNNGCIAVAARMTASPVNDPGEYQRALSAQDTIAGAGMMQYAFGLLMLWGLWSFYSGSLHSILLTWFLHETYSKVTSEGSVSARYKNAILVLEILTVLVAIYWSRLPGIDSAVGGVMSAYTSAFTSLFGG